MTKPEFIKTVGDIPHNVRGAAAYGILKLATGGYDVFMIDTEGRRSTIGHKPSEQKAIHMAIRYQKKENAAAIKRNKKASA